ncbi:hypothetical protein FB45DRAFT_292490 [Roridomyces roridus]|uniref:Uncharacterized protein n=1 Tax=Roridomyces roridus TaxID=1738132 RepID=A0AAD7CB86_9AGAR|nr:hypothetical protein FB45DRAFT_292490 [Roridomyces roridus]
MPFLTLWPKVHLNPDHVVRPKFAHLLDASYRPFLLLELPVEIGLQILSSAASCSQEAYRSLLLTNKSINALVRVEMFPGVVVLQNKRQLVAFLNFIAQYPEFIQKVHALWTICSGPVQHHARASMEIIRACTSVRSLACHSYVLQHAISSAQSVATHTRLVDLTLAEFDRANWNALLHFYPAVHRLFHQIERLHCVGAPASIWTEFPELNKLTRLSIGMGVHKHIHESLFRNVLRSPKLQQIVITTRLHGEEQSALSSQVQQIDNRFSVLHKRRRWKELTLFCESVLDPERFWDQAKAEKNS